MAEKDTRQEGTPGSESDRGDALGGIPAEVRSTWREFKDVLRGMMSLGDMAGDLAMDVYRLVVKAAKFASRHGGRAAAIGALIGVSSPLTGGWGVWESDWAIWAPVVVLPSLAMAFRAILISFGALDREGERKQKRLSDEHPEPQLQKRLSHDAVRRRHANTSIGTGSEEPLLEQHAGMVLEALDELSYQLSARALSDVTLNVRRWTRRKGCKEVALRGVLDDVVKGRLEALAWDEMVDFDRAVGTALEPLEYFHATTAFSVGAHHYLLVGIAGSPFPGHARLEISHTATRIVERLAYGDEAGESRSGSL